MNADVVMIIGANPTDGHPVFASQLKRRLRQGAKLIIADPREIALVRTPHIEADEHLQLKPGTNVALLNALAHVVVTEGLAREAYVAERCEPDSYAKWKAFVAEPRNSPEESESITGVPAARVRRAARLYATAGNGAIYYGLGVTEHSQGTTAVMGIANLAMATGNLGREGVGVSPLRGQHNVPGSSFLEKDGTFTNAERRTSRVRKIIEPLAGYQDWEITCLLSEALGYPMRYGHAGEILEEIARLTPTFAGMSFEKIDRLGSV